LKRVIRPLKHIIKKALLHGLRKFGGHPRIRLAMDCESEVGRSAKAKKKEKCEINKKWTLLHGL